MAIFTCPAGPVFRLYPFCGLFAPNNESFTAKVPFVKF